MLKLADTGELVESTAWTVNVKSPVAFGVPAIEPSLARARPPGSAPAVRDQTTVPTLPEAERLAEYGVPMIPFSSEVVVIRKPAFTCRMTVAVAVFSAESWTVRLSGNEPAAPGVPEIRPPVFTLRPCGTPDADQLYPPLPPDAESDCE